MDDVRRKPPPYSEASKGDQGAASSRVLATILGALVLLAAAAGLTVLGFGKLNEMRLLERSPPIDIVNIVGGVVNLSGRAESRGAQVQAPFSGASTFFYFATIDRQERDSEGRTRWVRVSSSSDAVPFDLVDETGRIETRRDGARIDVNLSFESFRGDRRYREWRIDSGLRLFAFGVAEYGPGGWRLRFDAPGHYSPILSTSSEEVNRQRLAGESMLSTWAALAAMSVAILLLCQAGGIRRAAIVLLALTGGTFIALSGWGWNAARTNLDAAVEYQADSERLAREAIRIGFDRQGRAWDGDWARLEPLLADLEAQGREQQAAAASARRIRMNLVRITERTQKTWEVWPERSIAARSGLAPPAAIPLPEADRQALSAIDMHYSPTRLDPGTAALAAGFGALLALILPWAGFGRILLKRRIESIPTSPTAGVAYGLSGLKGTIEPLPDVAPLAAPLTGVPCVHYRYLIEEKRGSGRNAKWVRVHSASDQQRFLCRDDDGTFLIDPQAAEITANTVVRHIGGRRHTETILAVGAPLYALGHAGIDPDTGQSLLLTKGNGPYLLSVRGEDELVERQARIGFLLLAGGFLGAVAAALSLAGGSGAFSGLTYLSASVVAPVFLLIVLLLLMFNDLVFLRERVRRTWANIDVSLKKRADLLPNLEAVVRQVMAHERAVLDDLAAARAQASQSGPFDQRQAQDMMASERRALDRLLALRESYPELGSAGPAGRLMDSLIALENEIAFMREGFNNAVERFNTCRNHFPEAILTRLFGVRRVEPFAAPVEVREVPSASLPPSAA